MAGNPWKRCVFGAENGTGGRQGWISLTAPNIDGSPKDPMRHIVQSFSSRWLVRFPRQSLSALLWRSIFRQFLCVFVWILPQSVFQRQRQTVQCGTGVCGVPMPRRCVAAAVAAALCVVCVCVEAEFEGFEEGDAAARRQRLLEEAAAITIPADHDK